MDNPLFKRLKLCVILVILVLLFSSCAQNQSSVKGIKVVATTTLVGDVVKQVGGDQISLTVLLPVGADPHTYEPRPQDAAAISNAHLIFINGLELEHSLEPILQNNSKSQIIEVSAGVNVLPFSGELPVSSPQNSATADVHALGDPHTWMDPNNVIIWVHNIEKGLSAADPANKDLYAKNAFDYILKLQSLDQWIRSEVSLVPVQNRKLVTDHMTFGYFSKAYGFEQAGLVIASLSSSAAPSAQELASLEKTISDQHITSLFVDSTVNTVMADQISRDTGIKVVKIYSGSLGGPGSGAENYLDFMRVDVTAIVTALK
jgi:ABC-type Zn uptake system ZnuABC Zn-binding protein ZnuA